mgnify:FL=1
MGMHRSRLRVFVFCLILLGFSQNVMPQHMWSFRGVEYPTQAEAEAAMKGRSTPQYSGLLEYWYEDFNWRDPATKNHWYTIFEFQPVTSSELWGYSVSPALCGIWGGTRCEDSVDEAISAWVEATYPYCDLEYTIGEFEMKEQQWDEVLEHGIRFWAVEKAPLQITVYYTNAETGACQSPQLIHSTMLRTYLAECTQDLAPVRQDVLRFDPKPIYPVVCSPSGHEPPIEKLAAISRRVTAVCTPPEGNPCSPMTGNKSLKETDFKSR